MDEAGAMLWGRVTYEMMESYSPAVARGPLAIRSTCTPLRVMIDQTYLVGSGEMQVYQRLSGGRSHAIDEAT